MSDETTNVTSLTGEKLTAEQAAPKDVDIAFYVLVAGKEGPEPKHVFTVRASGFSMTTDMVVVEDALSPTTRAFPLKDYCSISITEVEPNETTEVELYTGEE